MTQSIHMVTEYGSAYDLLGSMAAEIGAAMRQAGHAVNADNPATTLMWLNHLSSLATLAPFARSSNAPALVQFLVDHPLSIQADQMDRLAQLPTFRLLLPCLDGAHLLRLRWPRLKHAHCLHAVGPGALCAEGGLERSHVAPADAGGREWDVIVTGSIHGAGEVERLYAGLPSWLQPRVRELADHLLAWPAAPFESAADVVLGQDRIITGDWRVLAASWRVATADVNRRRRVALLATLAGLKTVVYGSEAWAPECTGTVAYRGRVPYADLPSVLASAKTCLAWSPTQFTTCFSERLLLALAAGCAVVTEDRPMVRTWFWRDEAQRCVKLFDAGKPETARAQIARLLHDDQRRLTLASRGRAEVEARHLWRHRVATLLTASGETAAIAA